MWNPGFEPWHWVLPQLNKIGVWHGKTSFLGNAAPSQVFIVCKLQDKPVNKDTVCFVSSLICAALEQA